MIKVSIKHRIHTALAVAVTFMIAVAGVVNATPASAHNGTVTCSTSAVVGMWVNVSGGTSGWATLDSTSDQRVKYWTFNTQGKQWNANIGCGGTSQSWAQSIHLNWTTMSNGSILCTDVGYIRACTIS